MIGGTESSGCNPCRPGYGGGIHPDSVLMLGLELRLWPYYLCIVRVVFVVYAGMMPLAVAGLD